MATILRNSRTRARLLSAGLMLAIVLVSAALATPSACGKNFTMLYSFTGGADGGSPWAGLVLDAAGNLYGTTIYGGASDYGTVFKVDTTGKETVLYSFTGINGDGAYPFAKLLLDASGNLYGTTLEGGTLGYGTAFKLDTAGNETVLYSFAGGTNDGAYPYAGLAQDSAGNLYGTTYEGGEGGTVFKLDETGKETIVYSFRDWTDGGLPLAGVVLDGAGNLYGTTSSGGDVENCGSNGCGTVFKVDANGNETVLYTFEGNGRFGSGGAFPGYGFLVRDSAGNLYGTTESGGHWGFRLGTVFKMDTNGKLTYLHGFRGAGDRGSTPMGGLVQDQNGNLYGTTYYGGPPGDGVVFKLDSNNGHQTMLHNFRDKDGAGPIGDLILDANGNLYGTTLVGGTHGAGTVFKVTP
jgi:uncharacterized repeat protein (TIGR03803 family)